LHQISQIGKRSLIHSGVAREGGSKWGMRPGAQALGAQQRTFCS